MYAYKMTHVIYYYRSRHYDERRLFPKLYTHTHTYVSIYKNNILRYTYIIQSDQNVALEK